MIRFRSSKRLRKKKQKRSVKKIIKIKSNEYAVIKTRKYCNFIEYILNEEKSDSSIERIKKYIDSLEMNYDSLNPEVMMRICRCLNKGTVNVRLCFEFLTTSIIAFISLCVAVLTLNHEIGKNEGILNTCILVVALILLVMASLYMGYCFYKINKYEKLGFNTIYFEIAVLLEEEKKKTKPFERR